jgi:cytochrome c
MFAKANSLEEVVNMCIMNALKGKPLDPKLKDMSSIVAYINSLAPKK